MVKTVSQLLLIECRVGEAVPSILDKVMALHFHSLWVMTIITKDISAISFFDYLLQFVWRYKNSPLMLKTKRKPHGLAATPIMIHI